MSHGVKIRFDVFFLLKMGGWMFLEDASHLLVDFRGVFVATQIMASCRDFGEDFRLQGFQPKIWNLQVFFFGQVFFFCIFESKDFNPKIQVMNPKKSKSCRR